MVFKPFKPPLIRNTLYSRPSPETSTSTTKHTTADSHSGPPAKRQRLQDEPIVISDDATARSLGSRKPLLQVRNRGQGAGNSNGTGDGDDGRQEDSSEERYYNALWRKPSTKKNKTWDGDGILSVRDGYAYLQDISGRDMGRVRSGSSRLEPGAVLSVGGKEVEIDSEIPRKEYLSGKVFLENKGGGSSAPSVPKMEFTPVLPVKSKPAATGLTSGSVSSTDRPRAGPGKGLDAILGGGKASKVKSTFNAYKNPLLESTVVPQAPAGEPTPRHDAKLPGALVMKRPSSAPKGKRIVDVVVDPILTKHLRQHQREGVQFLYECVMGMRSFNGEGAILADDMGLGKTLQTIALLWTLLKQNPIYENPPVVKKALIVCPVTLVSNWRKEFRKWLGNERIGVFVFDDKRKRLTDFTMGKAYNIMIVGYEKLRTVQEGLARGAGVDIVIMDEGHRLKTLQNKSGQAIQALNASKRVILSGTPIQNDLREFFAAIDLVNPGVLGTFKAFVKEFEGPIVRSRQPEATRKEIEKGEARNEELRELTSQFMLRRTADILAKYLPPKTEYVLFCTPTPTQANIYRNVLASPMFQCAIGNSEGALQLITILKKLCNSPSLLSAKNTAESTNDSMSALLSSLPPNLLRHFSPSCSAKIRVLDQFLYNLRTTTSEKVVLVSNYTSTLTLLANLLSSLSLPFLRLDGSTPAQKRQSLVEDFNRLPSDLCFAFLLSAKAGGTGLNLIGASRLVLFDVDWNPATDIQAMARIHRDGQKRHCRIYRILLKGSLEEKIWQRQVTKIGLADSVMEQKDSVAQFSRDELKDLFRLDEESLCQTHELLGCDCDGRGQPPASASNSEPTSISPSDDDDDNASETDTSSVASLPDLPSLIKASELNMEEQERIYQAARQTKAKSNPKSSFKKSSNGKPNHQSKDKNRNKMAQSLSQYMHINPSLLLSSSSSAKDGDNNDEGEEKGLELQTAIDDDNVLGSLLKEEDNRVKFIFKKTSRAEAEGVVSTGSAAGPGAQVGNHAGTSAEVIVVD